MNKTIYLFILSFFILGSYASSASAERLKDIQGHWAKDEIEQAVAEGWVSGYPDGTFRPNANVTRAELVKMISKANHIYFGEGSTVQEFLEKPQAPSHFKDTVNHWVWKQGIMQPAISWGIVEPSDYGNGGFGPNHHATRREVSVMAVRAMGEVFEAQKTDVTLPYKDINKIPKWARGYVNVVSDAGVVKGYPNGTFAQEKKSTRAEAVAIILRQLNYNRQGIVHDIKLKVLGGRNDIEAIDKAPKVPIQIVDQTIFVPLRTVFFDQQRWSWQPLKQAMFFYYDVDFQYTAGTNDYWFYGSKAGDLLQPVRVLNGELMLPVYHFGKGRLEPGIFHFDAKWEEETRTLSVKPLLVGAPIS